MSIARERARKLITAEELWEMPEVPGCILELADGELVQVPGSGGLHGLIVGQLLRVIGAFVRGRDLGFVLGDNASYLLRRDPDRLRIPDVSFVSWDQVPEEGIPDWYRIGAPDLAVEIIPPAGAVGETERKVSEYLDAGTKLVWMLWPKSRAVTVRERNGRTHELGPDDELDGGEVLPGFRVRVAELFAVRRSR